MLINLFGKSKVMNIAIIGDDSLPKSTLVHAKVSWSRGRVPSNLYLTVSVTVSNGNERLTNGTRKLTLVRPLRELARPRALLIITVWPNSATARGW